MISDERCKLFMIKRKLYRKRKDSKIIEKEMIEKIIKIL